MSNTIVAENLNGQKQTIILTNANTDDFCFDGWHYLKDYKGVSISFYWDNEKKEVEHLFENNSSDDEHYLDVKEAAFSWLYS